jgi:hypothetical protein
MSEQANNMNQGVPTDPNPRVPPDVSRAFPWVRVFTSDKEFGQAAVKAIKDTYSNAFTDRGVVQWKKQREDKPIKVEFFYTLGREHTRKGEEVDTLEKILAFVLQELHAMGAR